MTVQISVIVVGQGGVVGDCVSSAIAGAIAGEGHGEAKIVVLGGNVGREPLEGIKLPEENAAPFIEELELATGRTPILDGAVAAARMLPTMLVASPKICPTILVACCIWPFTSRRRLDWLAVPSPKTEALAGSGVACSSAAPADAAFATSLPPPSIAEATAAISPIRLFSTS